MRKFATLIVLLCATTAHAETVTLPAFAPPLGKDMPYRVQTETTLTLAGKGTKSVRGDFHNTLTVAERIADGFRATWRVDAAAPEGGAFEANEFYRKTIELYGLSSIPVDLDARGEAIRLNDDGAIKRNMETAIRNTFGDVPVPPGTVLETMLKRIAADPMMPVQALVPALALMTQMQTPSDKDFEVGKVNTLEAGPRAFGELTAATTSRWSLQSVDRAARTVTFTWHDVADPKTIAQRAKRYIDGEIEAARRARGALAADEMKELTATSAERRSMARLSLDDGMTVYAEETVALRMGPMRNETTVRITRE